MQPQETTKQMMSDEQLQRYHAALARIDALQDENPDDTICGADHDRILYGNESKT